MCNISLFLVLYFLVAPTKTDEIKKSEASHSFSVWFCSFEWQVIAQTEPDAQIVVYSEGSILPCAVSSDMTFMQVAAQLIKVRLCWENILCYKNVTLIFLWKHRDMLYPVNTTRLQHNCTPWMHSNNKIHSHTSVVTRTLVTNTNCSHQTPLWIIRSSSALVIIQMWLLSRLPVAVQTVPYPSPGPQRMIKLWTSSSFSLIIKRLGGKIQQTHWRLIDKWVQPERNAKVMCFSLLYC